jgi:hypothetical protein
VNSLARVPTNRSADRVVPISEWLGVNENPDGDTGLRLGEAAAMTNFKITNNKKLQKRPGTQNVANLLAAYNITTATETTDVLTELITTSAEFTVYPTIDVTDGGLLTLTGATATMNYANHATHTDKYYQDINGVIWKFADSVFNDGVVGGIQQYRWNKWNAQPTMTYFYTINGVLDSRNAPTTISGYTSYTFNSSTGAYATAGTYTSLSGSGTLYNDSGFAINTGTETQIYHWSISYTSSTAYSKGSTSYGYVYGATSAYPSNGEQLDGGTYYWYDNKVANTTYTWKFKRMSVVSDTGSAPVQGIWSGRVGANEVICAACDGRLWQLSETDGVWTKASVGSINTDNPVHFFGYDTKLYILNGTEYVVWNGTTLSTVTGYRPLTHVATPPAGGGTQLERINMLNGQRRVRFSPDGTAVDYQLPETALASIDYVKNLVTGTNYTLTTHYSVNTTTGQVTFVVGSKPAAGTNTIEIGYTASSTLRSQIEAMKRAELYNGQNDNRVFIYGDGSNKAFYSGLDNNGQPTAEYFPDLNVVHIGDANTPIYDLLRHYGELMTFKDGSAHRIKYGQITLADDTVTAAFYVETVNKGIGGSGYGQAQLVENNPRTLDGRSIYEWTATTSSGGITSDQRNAQKISQKVHKTIRDMDLSKAITFYDKINKEYFIVENGVAIVQNTEIGVWYIYRNFPAVCMIVYKDELYFGTADGYIRHVSRNDRHDVGEPITCYWESGSMAFGKEFMRKYTDKLYVTLLPEQYSEVYVTLQSDKQNDYTEAEILSMFSAVASGIFDFANLNFEHFTFNLNDKPQMQSKKIKVKNYAFLKLLLLTATDDTTCTVLGVDIKVRETGMVK